jgi:hypothetical protein
MSKTLGSIPSADAERKKKEGEREGEMEGGRDEGREGEEGRKEGRKERKIPFTPGKSLLPFLIFV